MRSQATTRGTVLAAAALLLGGALVIGATQPGRQATAAPAAPAPTTPTIPASAGAAGSGITVTGSAEVAGAPDTLRLDLSVTAKADSVSKALDQANRTVTRVQDSLRHHGVGARDLQTSDLQVQPDYSYPGNGTPVLRGYDVTEGLTARLRDLGKAGAAISEATTAGGDALRVNGIQLDLGDSSRLVAAARDKAMADAKAKAEQYARAAGRSLGPVVSVSEDVSQPPPVDYPMRTAAADAKPVPIQPGSQDVGVRVTVVYAFG